MDDVMDAASAERFEAVFGCPYPSQSPPPVRHIDVDALMAELALKTRRRPEVVAVVPKWLRDLERRGAASSAADQRRRAAVDLMVRRARRNRRIRWVIGRKPRRRRFVSRLLWRLAFSALGGTPA